MVPTSKMWETYITSICMSTLLCDTTDEIEIGCLTFITRDFILHTQLEDKERNTPIHFGVNSQGNNDVPPAGPSLSSFTRHLWDWCTFPDWAILEFSLPFGQTVLNNNCFQDAKLERSPESWQTIPAEDDAENGADRTEVYRCAAAETTSDATVCRRPGGEGNCIQCMTRNRGLQTCCSNYIQCITRNRGLQTCCSNYIQCITRNRGLLTCCSNYIQCMTRNRGLQMCCSNYIQCMTRNRGLQTCCSNYIQCMTRNRGLLMCCSNYIQCMTRYRGLQTCCSNYIQCMTIYRGFTDVLQ